MGVIFSGQGQRTGGLTAANGGTGSGDMGGVGSSGAQGTDVAGNGSGGTGGGSKHSTQAGNGPVSTSSVRVRVAVAGMGREQTGGFGRAQGIGGSDGTWGSNRGWNGLARLWDGRWACTDWAEAAVAGTGKGNRGGLTVANSGTGSGGMGGGGSSGAVTGVDDDERAMRPGGSDTIGL